MSRRTWVFGGVSLATVLAGMFLLAARNPLGFAFVGQFHGERIPYPLKVDRMEKLTALAASESTCYGFVGNAKDVRRAVVQELELDGWKSEDDGLPAFLNFNKGAVYDPVSFISDRSMFHADRRYTCVVIIPNDHPSESFLTRIRMALHMH